MKDVEKIVDSNGVVMQIVDGAARDMIAAEYDATASYAVGDYCIYNDHYYKCKTAIPSGGETWDATHWDATTLGAEDRAIKSALSQLNGLNVIKRITTPASIISFSDGSNLPMYKLEIEIDNVSGCTEANVVVSPLNIASLYNGQIYEDGSWVGNNARLTNVQTAQSNVYFLKAGTYTLDYDKLNSNAPSLLACSLLTKDDNYTIIDNFANAWNSLPFTFTLTQDGYLYSTVRKDSSTTLNADDYKVKILGQSYNVEFKDGSNPLTVYSGTLDIITGLLTDNDTTPPTYYNLPPISAKTLRDNNNIYCDTGNIIEVDYTGVINFS